MRKNLLLAFLLMIEFIHADPVVLTNNGGKSIYVSIVSANEAKVIVRRPNEQRQFSIEIGTLDPESMKIIETWRKLQPTIPTEKKIHSFADTSPLDKPAWSFDFRFKLPKHEYEFSDLGHEVIYSFDIEGQKNPAQVRIRPSINWKTVDDIANFLDLVLAKRKREATPQKLESYEKHPGFMEKHKVEVGSFTGFYIEKEVNGYSREYRITDGKVHVEIRMVNTVPKGVINFENIEAIIATMEVTSLKEK